MLIFVIIEYAISWVKAKFVNSKKWHNTIPILTRIQNRFGPPRKLISNKAPEFNGKTAEKWHRKYGTRMLPITPYRPRGNGKIEQVNDVLKGIISRINLINPGFLLPDLLQAAVNTHNRTPRPNGYSSYFLFYGTISPDRTSPEAYIRKSTRKKEEIHEKELAQHHKAPVAKARANSLKASRNQVRAYLQKKKALLRVYAPGDWMLRVRQRDYKLKPFYDRPWAVLSCYNGNTYKLYSPGGIIFGNKYNGTNLFLAYVLNGYSV
jgi:hypothetical protein